MKKLFIIVQDVKGLPKEGLKEGLKVLSKEKLKVLLKEEPKVLPKEKRRVNALLLPT